MASALTIACLWTLLSSPSVLGASTTTPAPTLEDEVKELRAVSQRLARQLMSQQLYVEEMTRTGGDSGLKQTRLKKDGVKDYNAISRSMASIHDHSNLKDTCGMGEVVAVLNGVEFRTRHNDYKLRKPSTTSSGYHDLEDIQFPGVPENVTSLPTLDEQIAEMRLWFKAWKDGNSTERDYRRYFRPVLCYLEGAWTTDVDEVVEPFPSDRHHIDAGTWQDLQNLIRFLSYTGGKSHLENVAYLPNTLMNITEDGQLVFAQWNYRILCHPLNDDIDLKLSDLTPVDILSQRLTNNIKWKNYPDKRAARFAFKQHELDSDNKWNLLDRLMAQIPGKDNYPANIRDDVFGISKLDVLAASETELNTGYYSRWCKTREPSAMGDKELHTGFHDSNLFVAHTTQPRVAPVSTQLCNKKKGKNRNCTTVEKRVSYAIPLEIVWLTPLNTWNPYDIIYRGEHDSDEGKKVKADGRKGSKTNSSLAFDGTNSKTYYLTPTEFFSSKEVNKDSADTTRNSVGVQDSKGQLRVVSAAGIRVMLPEIEDVGILRTRFPIAPMHDEGSNVRMELEALKDMVMDMGYFSDYFQVSPPYASADATPAPISTAAPPNQAQILYQFETSESSATAAVERHQHTFFLSQAQYLALTTTNAKINVTTSVDSGHSHVLLVNYNSNRNKYKITACDGLARCSDGHWARLFRV